MVLFSAFYSTSQPAEAELTVLLITISAAIYLMILIIEIENMRQLLLDGGDAAGIFAVDDVCDFLWHFHPFFLYDMAVLDDIDRDVVIDVSQDIQIYQVKAAVDLDYIFFAHLAALGILNDCSLALKLFQSQFIIDIHTFACLDMIQYNALG